MSRTEPVPQPAECVVYRCEHPPRFRYRFPGIDEESGLCLDHAPMVGCNADRQGIPIMLVPIPLPE